SASHRDLLCLPTRRSSDLQLDFYVSAGILTILCIQPTKKRSIRAALSRFIASLIAIVYAFVFLEGIGYHPAVVGIMILLFIPVRSEEHTSELQSRESLVCR